jgi:hypothetical protein
VTVSLADLVQLEDKYGSLEAAAEALPERRDEILAAAERERRMAEEVRKALSPALSQLPTVRRLTPARRISATSAAARGGSLSITPLVDSSSSSCAATRSPSSKSSTSALPDGFLTRSDLREMGLPRSAVDAIFRALPVVLVPGYRRPMIRTADFLAFIAEHTFGNDEVHPS